MSFRQEVLLCFWHTWYTVSDFMEDTIEKTLTKIFNKDGRVDEWVV